MVCQVGVVVGRVGAFAGAGWVFELVCIAAVGCRVLDQSVCSCSVPWAWVLWVEKVLVQSVFGMLPGACGS